MNLKIFFWEKVCSQLSNNSPHRNKWFKRFIQNTWRQGGPKELELQDKAKQFRCALLKCYSFIHIKLNISLFSYFKDEIYLGHSAAIPGKLLDHLGSWPPKRPPWCSQKTSIQKLQTGFHENNWPRLSLSPIQCLHCGLQH